MKNLQRNDFYLDQQTLMNMEANLLMQTVNYVSHNPVDNQKIVEEIYQRPLKKWILNLKTNLQIF